MVQNLIKNYFDFLFYIGITTDETSPKIIPLLSKKYNNISNQENDINNLLESLTCDYLKSLDKKQLELIGKNIYRQYLRNKLISELKIVKKLLIIRYNFFKRKKKKYFNKWRLSTINSDITNYFFLNKNYSVKSIKTTRSSSKKNIIKTKYFLDKLDYYSDKKKENTNKIKLMSEYNLTNECTFKPNLKSKYKRSNSKKNFIKGENKSINKFENDKNGSFKEFIEILKMDHNNNKSDERQMSNRKNNSHEKNKETNIKNKKDRYINNNYFFRGKTKTTEKKNKKAFKV